MQWVLTRRVCHRSDSISTLNADNCRFEGNQGLARSNVALQQAPHRKRLLHVAGNFLQRALLSIGRMKRQDSFDRLTHRVTELKCNASLRLLLATLEFETQLDKE